MTFDPKRGIGQTGPRSPAPCRWAAYALLLAALPGCAVSWVNEDGSQHNAGLMWLRYRQGPAGALLEARQLGLAARFDTGCAGLYLGAERTGLAAAAPALSAQSLPGGWRDGDGIGNHLGLVWSTYRPGAGPRLKHTEGIGLALRGGPDCLGLRLGWQDSLRILYPDANAYWQADYDSSAPFDMRIVPGRP
ncbi:MAG: hypothetical protein HY850_12715 [Betaproteobacteria bacterium]|nr:hypothetical protein [Betaproteobacteria bacterium]